MPNYEYKCKHCNHKFENVSSWMESHDMKCPRCGGETQRLISMPNLKTDTNFGYTGKVDKRLGKRPIEGRKDFWNRVEEKGLQEIDLKNVD